jgi:hypothetical protein
MHATAFIFTQPLLLAAAVAVIAHRVLASVLHCVRLQVDVLKAGCILDDELFQTLVEPLPEGCQMTVFMDCCHAGTLCTHTCIQQYHLLIILVCVHSCKLVQC